METFIYVEKVAIKMIIYTETILKSVPCVDPYQFFVPSSMLTFYYQM